MSVQMELFEQKDVVEVVNHDIVRETYELMEEAREDILSAYLDESLEGPCMVGFSGGKDSTLTLKLVFEAVSVLPVEMRKREIHVVCTDTMVETPLVHEHMKRQMQQIKLYVEENKIPAKVQMLHRELKDSYFYVVLGKGYRLPDNARRYCTDRLKLKPQDAYVEEHRPSVIMTGVRSTESARRMSIYKERWKDDAFHPFAKKFYPILSFTIEHVWEALKAPLPWGSSIYVRNIYREATGECGFTNPSATDKPKVDACGARFGCWVCPVVNADKSTEQMAFHHPWLEPLTKWRELHMIVTGQYTPPTDWTKSRKDRSKELRMWEEINKVVRYLSKAGHDRKGQRLNDGVGTLNTEARKFLFEKLIETQMEMNELREESNLEHIELISTEECNMIINQIVEDETERPWLSTGIKKFGEVFERKVSEIESKHQKYWDEEPLRCFNCTRKMKIIRPGVQECQKCNRKAKQLKLEV